MALKIELKRYNGSNYDTLYPKTSWTNIEDKPSTFTPTSHSHDGLTFYVEGNTSGTTGIWTGTHSDITSYYAGLVVNYKIGINGASTTTLNINGLGAKTVYRNTSNLTTHLGVGTIVSLVYSGTGWIWADYSNPDTTNTAGATNTSSKIYLVGATAQTANPQTYSHDTAYVGTDGCVYSNGTKTSVEGHTHSYLSTNGGTVGGDITLSPAGAAQADQKAIKWKPIASKNPYFGYALDQTDGTFVWSITGTNYASGLAIGGGSGNLLYKGGVVLTANNISSYAATTGHTHALSDVSSHISESSGGVSIYGYPNNDSTLLFLGDDGTFEHNGNTVITTGNVSGYVSTYGYATSSVAGLVKISFASGVLNIMTS